MNHFLFVCLLLSIERAKIETISNLHTFGIKYGICVEKLKRKKKKRKTEIIRGQTKNITQTAKRNEKNKTTTKR